MRDLLQDVEKESFSLEKSLEATLVLYSKVKKEICMRRAICDLEGLDP